MKTIEKKILPEYFNEILKGNKAFELRKDEDNIQVGDHIVLNEFDGSEFTGRSITTTVSYVLRDVPQYGLMEGYCIIGLDRKMWVTGVVVPEMLTDRILYGAGVPYEGRYKSGERLGDTQKWK